MNFENPYMLYVGKTQKDNLQSITHVDGTCRVQTVSTGLFRELLKKFHELTGCPVLMNTSLNVSGKPIAGYIKDVKLEFLNNKKIDMLVIGDDIYER
jgi:carbamoyltransferase